jgi:hypothetical protein
MASNIVPGNIDGTYPKAGQDNSSQGFRDNFSAIKNNFTEAKTEIESLQTNKANLNATNNFSGNVISNAVLQTATITADTTFSFLNLPSSGSLGRIILDITVSVGATNLIFPSAVIKADNVGGSDGTSDTIAPGLGRALYEFMSPDGGTTILMHQLGKQYA